MRRAPRRAEAQEAKAIWLQEKRSVSPFDFAFACLVLMRASLTAMALGGARRKLLGAASTGAADLMPDRVQLAGQAARAFAVPPRRRHRIATLTRANQRQPLLGSLRSGFASLRHHGNGAFLC